jgi:hypothetical protein
MKHTTGVDIYVSYVQDRFNCPQLSMSWLLKFLLSMYC